MSGAASTGKSSFALSLLANVTLLGNACAWVDVNDALSPESAAAAGVELVADALAADVGGAQTQTQRKAVVTAGASPQSDRPFACKREASSRRLCST